MGLVLTNPQEEVQQREVQSIEPGALACIWLVHIKCAASGTASFCWSSADRSGSTRCMRHARQKRDRRKELEQEAGVGQPWSQMRLSLCAKMGPFRHGPDGSHTHRWHGQALSLNPTSYVEK